MIMVKAQGMLRHSFRMKPSEKETANSSYLYDVRQTAKGSADGGTP